ncbi:hypothetical protein [Nocardia sp. alder85J]|uniref:hypothetical protein n=1 Tax=Nocardia sp. alder85J TaxID=2862949 RepID=UPI001CD4F094|nr:hypothetical protein [Nocardia sp. alder85J]MCX4095398.1 hypothetical protein [Nocardia sp. alder85J]
MSAVNRAPYWGWTAPVALAALIGGLILTGVFAAVWLPASRLAVDLSGLLGLRFATMVLMALFGFGITAVQTTAFAYLAASPGPDALRNDIAVSVVQQARASYGVNISAASVHVTLNPGYSYGSALSTVHFAALMIAAGLATVIAAIGAGLLARRVGGRLPAIAAVALFAVSGLGFAVLPYHLIGATALTALAGFGVGLLYPAAIELITETIPAGLQGIGAAVFGVALTVGSTAAVAAFTAIRDRHPVAADVQLRGGRTRQVVPQLFADQGYTLGFWVALAPTAIGLLLAVALLLTPGSVRTPPPVPVPPPFAPQGGFPIPR